jgi:CubicO group peptidase (beta-lactamase class C family)
MLTLQRTTVIAALAVSAFSVGSLPGLATAEEGEGAGRAARADVEAVSPARARELDAAFLALIERHGINTAGVGVIQDGRLAWQNQYGQQSPGVPACAGTLFNIASITKTVTAETVLRLVADGQLSLDESISRYWVDPDLKDDPTHYKLTARMALTHTTGFVNWRYFSADRKLRFVNPPGTTFGYSGEGFEYLAKYAENKLGQPFEGLVQTQVFDPVEMTNVSFSVREANFPRIARPLDSDGTFYGYYCRPGGWCREEGDSSAAGSMVVTVEDYARFLISSMRGEGLSPELHKERDTIQVDEEGIDCSASPEARCPTRVGYGLGWNITQLADTKVIGHRGSDWSAVSLAYYYERSGDGLIVFFNAPNQAGIAGMVDALELLDPDSPELHGYRTRRARASQ